MSYLYVVEQGSQIGISGGYFSITKKGILLKEIPMELLESISVFGSVQITSTAISKCFENGIHINYFSSFGKFRGYLSMIDQYDVEKMQKQLIFSQDEQKRLEISKKLISAKIHNQRVVLRRYADNQFKNELIKMKRLEKKVMLAKDENFIRGYEGLASRTYFLSLANLIHEDFRFNNRNRRPAEDPFNAMLNFGYSLLYSEISGHVIAKKLNPYIGVLHKNRKGHMALVSDLIEEWRAVIIDSTILSMIQGHEINLDDFQWDDRGICLSFDGMKKVIHKIEKKLETTNKYMDYHNKNISFRREIWYQVNRFSKCIMNMECDTYRPIMIR